MTHQPRRRSSWKISRICSADWSACTRFITTCSIFQYKYSSQSWSSLGQIGPDIKLRRPAPLTETAWEHHLEPTKSTNGWARVSAIVMKVVWSTSVCQIEVSENSKNCAVEVGTKVNKDGKDLSNLRIISIFFTHKGPFSSVYWARNLDTTNETRCLVIR